MDNYDGYDDEDIDGLTIHDDLSFGDENDAAAQWLANQMMGDPSVSEELEPESPNEAYGGATASTLQLQRFSHVEPRIQAGIKAVLSGQAIDGIHPIDLAAAREEFGSVIGGDTAAFARQIKVDEAVQLPRHKDDIKIVMSMIGVTGQAYLERGPGGQMVNTYADEKRELKAEADLATAIGYVKELADIYLDPRTIGSSVEGVRRKALEESITKRLIDGVFYEGSKDTLPLPNETGVTGIRPTQGIYGSGQGTAFDRTSASKMDYMYVTYMQGQKTKFKRNDQGHKIFQSWVTKEQQAEVMRNTPSLKNSLFPKPRRIKDKTYTNAELAKQTRDQNYAMEQAQYKADFARRVLRQQMPSTRDESRDQIRMTGWDTPYDEQADLQNLRNEAAIQGVEWNSMYAGQADGESQSELSTYIEDQLEEISGRSVEPVQRDENWFKLRKGKITASTAGYLLKDGGVEERAMELALDRMGMGTKFQGNAHTVEGTIGEEKALRAFLSGPGKGLTQEEAYFIENDKYAGFGVSPDGLLYDEAGDSAGLLELKYLSSGSMKGALKQYTPQMQLQMAVTGEDTTHFYALDKYTGEYVHEVVKADPAMQEQIIKAGTQALELGASLDARGVRDLRKQIQSAAAKPRQRLGAKAEKIVGQTESFVPTNAEPDDVMTAFAGITAESGAGAASDTLMAKEMQKQENRYQEKLAKEAVNAAQPSEEISQSGTSLVPLPKKGTGIVRTDGGGGGQGGGGNNLPAQYDADFNDFESALEDVSDQLRSFGNEIKNVGRVAGEVANLVMSGNESGMSEVRGAAMAGISAGQARGMREALEMGGLDAGGINRTIGRAGSLVSTFNDEAKAAGEFTSLMSARGRSNLEEVRTMGMPSIQQFQGMDAQQLTSKVVGLMAGKSPEARMQIGQMFGMPELAANSSSPEAIMTVDGSINERNLRETSQGIQGAKQIIREGREEFGEVGEVGGAISSVVSTGAAIVGSATAGYVGSKIARRGGTSMANDFMKQATKTSKQAASAIKSVGKVAGRISPVGAAAALGTTVLRETGGIEDNGGIGDSLLDIAEFATYGAAIGSVVPGVGTAIGAGVGAGAGLLNEGYEYLFGDEEEAIPKKNIGAMQGQTRMEREEASKTVVNVEVLNEISPELIRTTTDVDGLISIDEENGLD